MLEGVAFLRPMANRNPLTCFCHRSKSRIALQRLLAFCFSESLMSLEQSGNGSAVYGGLLDSEGFVGIANAMEFRDMTAQFIGERIAGF